MRKYLFLSFFILLASSTVLRAQQVELLAIYHDNGRVVFDLSAKVDYNAFILKNPSRLVIDLKKTALAHYSLPSTLSSIFEQIRSAARNQDDLRVVFDLKTEVTFTTFIIKEHGEHKLMFDLPLVKEKANLVGRKLSVHPDKTFLEDGQGGFVERVSNASVDFFSDWEVSGKVSVEELGFFHHKLDSQQHNNYISGAMEAEIYREWDDGAQSFTFVPFFRVSQHDSKRTHFDIRELTWLLAEDSWELRVGFRKVFWGVSEGLHLVDIINQTDLVENSDTEDKLGQPMINLALIRDWGTLDLFVLPGFRERTFAGNEGRLRPFPQVDVGHALYEKHGIEKHLAYALRWSHVVGDLDVGISHFYGTGREPSFKVRVNNLGSVALVPYYELINQTGLDLQLTHEDWILKHEAIIRSGQGKTFYASSSGVEYTLFDLIDTGIDLGFVLEYMYDTRGSNNISAPFQDDFLTAVRLAFNDIQSTEILAGILFDRTNNARFYNIEASRRLGDSFTVDMEMRIYSGIPKFDPAYVLRNDDHVRFDVGYHF